MKFKASVYIGFDPRETEAYSVARHSALRCLLSQTPVRGLVLSTLTAQGLYTRPTSIPDGRLWDDISDAPMSTEFAISRFLVPHLASSGWALFMDGDVLVRKNLDQIFALADPSKAVMVVKHNHQPANATKMAGQPQTSYPRKNWSSVCLWNVGHKANAALTLDYINSAPGRDLHAFKWLDDDLIGELPAEWNWLVGHSDPSIDPSIVHFTDGVPTMPERENCAYADEWRGELMRWAA